MLEFLLCFAIGLLMQIAFSVYKNLNRIADALEDFVYDDEDEEESEVSDGNQKD